MDKSKFCGVVAALSGDLCMDFTLLSFIYYINNFPKLKNENINRVKFYIYNLFSDICTMDTSGMELVVDNKEVKSLIFSKLFRGSKDVENENFIKSSVLSLIITLLSYKEIANLISKKNIFTKNIKAKILDIKDSVILTLGMKIKNLKRRTIYINDVYILCNDVTLESKLKNVAERQSFRFSCKNFVEYGSNIGEFSIIQSEEQLVAKSKKPTYDYEKVFFGEFNEFLDEMLKISH
ncbi:MAG: hypothetical protein LBS34_03510 [Rickettsiales bacterium]|nr:hypothetical protein [Rickettsiales bacterium]